MSDRSGERTVQSSQEGRSEPRRKTERQTGRADPLASLPAPGENASPAASELERCRCEGAHAAADPQAHRPQRSAASDSGEVDSGDEFIFAAQGQISPVATGEFKVTPPGTPGSRFVHGSPRPGCLSNGLSMPASGASSLASSDDDAPGTPRSTGRTGWRSAWLWKSALSLWLLYHFSGLVISPASIQPSSDLQRDAWLAVGPYLQFISMNQGNHFFAPDPGPSTLVTYVAELKDGRKVTGQIPDRTTMQPRLLYHRHFMLTEQLAGLADAVDLDVETSKRLFDLHLRAIARQVCRQHGAQQVTLSRVTHVLREPEWAQAGMPLQHPENYQVKPLGRFEWTDF